MQMPNCGLIFKLIKIATKETRKIDAKFYYSFRKFAQNINEPANVFPRNVINLTLFLIQFFTKHFSIHCQFLVPGNNFS